MRIRIASVALFWGALSTGICWLSLQPLFIPLVRSVHHPIVAKIQSLLPFLLVLDFGVITALGFLLLHWTVGQPIERAQEAISQIGRTPKDANLDHPGGPFLSELQRGLKKAQGRLAQAQAELIATERLAMVGKLAAGVAHEIGNPLSGILGYLSLSKSRAQAIPAPDLIDFLDRIEHEVQRINQIVKSLLDLGRSPSEAIVPTDLSELVRTCIDLVAVGSEFERIQIIPEIGSEVIARARPGPYSQILLNLMLNGAQAMGGQGVLRVKLYPDDRWIVTEVEDQGQGISSEILPHLFEPFFTTKSSSQGTGLGLAVSLHLAKEMGGLLEVGTPRVPIQPPAGGASFCLKLPRMALGPEGV